MKDINATYSTKWVFVLFVISKHNAFRNEVEMAKQDIIVVV